MAASAEAFAREHVVFESLDRAALARRYPQIGLEDLAWGLLEKDSGALLARRSVQVLARECLRAGVEWIGAAAALPSVEMPRLESIALSSGERLTARLFVFACGPWLKTLFPAVVGTRIFPTRQEVFYFGAPAGDARFAPPA